MNSKTCVLSLLLAGTIASAASAVPVILPDNGSGTVDMPPMADYVNPPLYLGSNHFYITAGLPSGSSIVIDAVMNAPTVTDEQTGGSLGGTKSAGGGVPLF